MSLARAVRLQVRGGGDEPLLDAIVNGDADIGSSRLPNSWRNRVELPGPLPASTESYTSSRVYSWLCRLPDNAGPRAMLFNSPEFILGFLPAALAGFFLLGRIAGRDRAMRWLVCASLFFYGW